MTWRITTPYLDTELEFESDTRNGAIDLFAAWLRKSRQVYVVAAIDEIESEASNGKSPC